MNRMRRISVVLIAAAATLLVFAETPLLAQDDPFEDPADDAIEILEDGPVEADQPATPTQAVRVRQRPAAESDQPPSTAELLQRLDQSLEAAAATQAMLDEIAAGGEPSALTNQQRPADGDAPALPVRLVPEELHLGKVYGSDRHVRFLALQLWLVNTGPTRIDVPIEAIRLRVGDREITPNQMPPRQGLPHLPFGRRLLPVEQLRREGVVSIPAGEAATLPVAYFDLPGTNDVPAMTLQATVDGARSELDVNRYALGLMKLSIDRPGPGGMLGLMTVGGELTPVGAGSLADAIQTLTSAQSTRLVIAWDESAPPIPAELSNWLVQSATRPENAMQNNGPQPALSPSIAELHLAAIPEGTGVPNYGGRRHVHANVEEAVLAALDGGYDGIPLEILEHEITAGHRLTRPAAIAAGVRLPDDRLLLPLTADSDPAVAVAAVVALRGHGSPQTIDRLVVLAKSGSEPLRTAAVESLAASRYGAAHEALRGLLDESAQGTLAISPAALIPVLSDYPRPLWGDALYRLASQGDAAVRADALAALAQLGHPQLESAFRSALSSPDPALRQRAFAIVASRPGDAAETLAVDYMLKHLETEPPTREMSMLLVRTKEQRAVPLLLKQIDAGGPGRSALVQLLVQFGGSAMRDELESIYPKLDRGTQRQVLGTLAELRSPRFYEFAGSALRTNDPALVNAAAQELQSDGGPEAVELLAEVLRESDQPAVLSYVANGLAGIGTPEARQALRKARIDDGPRRDAADQAWWNLQRQSAAWEFFYAGWVAKERDDWQASIDRFTEGMEVDPQFVELWSERAGSHIQLQDYAAARADYEHALELDPDHPAAITCLGILQVLDGNVEAGLTFVTGRAREFRKNDLFAYNTACLYAVASERIEQDDAARAERLRVDAVKELERSIKLGMTQPKAIAWIREDPDLKSLHGRPDFENVVIAAETLMKQNQSARKAAE